MNYKELQKQYSFLKEYASFEDINWSYISQYQRLSEAFIERNSEKVYWSYISAYQKLSESFLERNSEKVYWSYISKYQKLSETFIEQFSEKVDWYYISKYQKLSESFLERNTEKVYWSYISQYQKLSESFIERNTEKVYWSYISEYQKLSESFLERNSEKVYWSYISQYQKLSESFIERNTEKVDWYYISAYQKLSKAFRKKHNLRISSGNWLYKTKKEKLKILKYLNVFEIKDDKEIIAYKSVRDGGYSVYNFQYQYKTGQTYKAINCDCDSERSNSFGLSAWTKEEALNYYSKGKLLKVSIPISKIGCITLGNKIRAFELKVLEEVKYE